MIESPCDLLVGGAITILKNINGKDYPIYEMENKTCLKPPTSLNILKCPKKQTPDLPWTSPSDDPQLASGRVPKDRQDSNWHQLCRGLGLLDMIYPHHLLYST